MILKLLVCLNFISAVYLVSSQSEPAQQLTAAQKALLYGRPRNFVRTANASKTSFTEEEKTLLLQLHNAYRSMVQPPATNMRELVWDSDLENYARQHSQVCSGAHSARSMLKVWSPLVSQRWDLMGENLYWSYGDRYSLEEAMWMFWEEGSGYDIDSNTCNHRLTCGHYKALVLESSWRVGCSINQCDGFTDNSYPGPAMFMTCNYNGMYLDAARPYTVGETCSGCDRETVGSQFANCRNRLCVTSQQIRRGTGFDGNTTLIGLQHSDFTSSEDSSEIHTRGITTSPTTFIRTTTPVHATTPTPTTTTAMQTTTAQQTTTAIRTTKAQLGTTATTPLQTTTSPWWPTPSRIRTTTPTTWWTTTSRIRTTTPDRTTTTPWWTTTSRIRTTTPDRTTTTPWWTTTSRIRTTTTAPWWATTSRIRTTTPDRTTTIPWWRTTSRTRTTTPTPWWATTSRIRTTPDRTTTSLILTTTVIRPTPTTTMRTWTTIPKQTTTASDVRATTDNPQFHHSDTTAFYAVTIETDEQDEQDLEREWAQFPGNQDIDFNNGPTIGGPYSTQIVVLCFLLSLFGSAVLIL